MNELEQLQIENIRLKERMSRIDEQYTLDIKFVAVIGVIVGMLIGYYLKTLVSG